MHFKVQQPWEDRSPMDKVLWRRSRLVLGFDCGTHKVNLDGTLCKSYLFSQPLPLELWRSIFYRIFWGGDTSILSTQPRSQQQPICGLHENGDRDAPQGSACWHGRATTFKGIQECTWVGEETCKKLKAYAEDGIWFRCGGVFRPWNERQGLKWSGRVKRERITADYF